MSKLERYEELQEHYPSTTAAAHNLVMRATELKLARLHHTWIELSGSNRAQVAFENALHETLLWAARESCERNTERLFKFTTNFVAQFALACKSWKNVMPEITEFLLSASTKKTSVLTDVVEMVKSEKSFLTGLGRPQGFHHAQV